MLSKDAGVEAPALAFQRADKHSTCSLVEKPHLSSSLAPPPSPTDIEWSKDTEPWVSWEVSKGSPQGGSIELRGKESQMKAKEPDISAHGTVSNFLKLEHKGQRLRWRGRNR